MLGDENLYFRCSFLWIITFELDLYFIPFKKYINSTTKMHLNDVIFVIIIFFMILDMTFVILLY